MTISLRKFLTTSLIAIFISGILTAMAFLHSTNSSSDAVNDLTETVESAAASEKLQQSLSVHRRQALLNGVVPNTERRLQTEAAKKELLQTSADLFKYANYEEEKVITQRVQVGVITYLANFDLLRSQGARHEILYAADTEKYNVAQEAIQDLMTFNIKKAQELQTMIADQNRTNYSIVTIALAFLFLTIAVLLVGLNILLFKPILQLKKQIEDFEVQEKFNDLKSLSAHEIKSIGLSFSKLAARLFKQKNLELTFLAAVAHEIKNPLGAIKMSTELLIETDGIARNEKELIGIIGRQTDQLFRLTNDLLDTTRIESGHLEIKLAKSDVAQVLRDAVRLHASLPGAKRLELQISNDRPLLAMCDQHRLAQVINNLLSNALKYSPDGGVIEINAKLENDFIVIAVNDNGIGILDEELEEIFEPFHRSNTTRDSIPGIGLGLSVSRKIMRAHQGDLTVFSKFGLGSTFVLKIKSLEIVRPQENSVSI